MKQKDIKQGEWYTYGTGKVKSLFFVKLIYEEILSIIGFNIDGDWANSLPSILPNELDESKLNIAGPIEVNDTLKAYALKKYKVGDTVRFGNSGLELTIEHDTGVLVDSSGNIAVGGIIVFDNDCKLWADILEEPAEYKYALSVKDKEIERLKEENKKLKDKHDHLINSVKFILDKMAEDDKIIQEKINNLNSYE